MTSRSNNGWTGGQYSLFRVLFGLWLFVSFAALFDEGAGWVWIVVEALVIPFVLGVRDREFAALILGLIFYVGTGASGESLALVACSWVLVVHLGLPPAPYGSLSAASRPDPGNGWRFPNGLFRATWVVLCGLYALDGAVSFLASFIPRIPFTNPAALAVRNILAVPANGPATAAAAALLCVAGFQVAFAMLAGLKRLRVTLWIVMLLVQLGVFIILGHSPIQAGLILLHLLAFDPAWVPPKSPASTDLMFYDGNCGLCHRAVRFILAEERSGTAFRFAPLGGESFLASLTETQRVGLPDSVVLLTSDGHLLTRSNAVVFMLLRLGGLWTVIGTVARLIPSHALDVAYDAIAQVRHKLFAKPKDACPIIPKHLRARFDG